MFYAELVTWSALEIVGLSLAGATGLVLLVTLCCYVWLQHRLATGEILAGTGGRDDQGGQP